MYKWNVNTDARFYYWGILQCSVEDASILLARGLEPKGIKNSTYKNTMLIKVVAEEWNDFIKAEDIIKEYGSVVYGKPTLKMTDDCEFSYVYQR